VGNIVAEFVREWDVMTEGLRAPEGPVAMPDGSVIVVEIQAGDVTRVRPDGTKEAVAHVGGGPNGAAIGPDGALYICNNGGYLWGEAHGLTFPIGVAADYTSGKIQRIDLASGDVTTLYTECGGEPLKAPNDIVFDGTGGFWFTDLGHNRGRSSDVGAVYYAKPDGSAITEVVFPIDDPNGIGLSPDGSRLYVADSVSGRLWAWDLEAPGTIRPTGIPFSPAGGLMLYNVTGFAGFDSLAVDGDGNVCVATLIDPGISVITPAGALDEFVQLPKFDPAVTNICFGGHDLRTAYITSSGLGLLYKTDWPRPGLKLAY
jgi:gluconolactonase